MVKKLLYRHIQKLESFACAYRILFNGVPLESGVSILFEVTKLYYDDSKNLHKSITYAVSHSNGEIPAFHDFGLFDIHVILLDDKRIKKLIAQCKSYGIKI